MDDIKVEKATEPEQATPVEAGAATPGKIEAELPVQDIVPLVNKVVAPPVAEISRLIDEMKEAKTHLETEGERIQRVVERYLQLNENTVESVKIIAAAVTEWRTEGHPAE